MKPSCKACIYFKGYVAPGDFRGECRANPPSQLSAGQAGAVFPIVLPNDWCGFGMAQDGTQFSDLLKSK